jgi:hypothetical protein
LAARAGDHWFSPASACRCAEETGRSPASSFQRRFLPHLGRPGASKRRAGPFYEGGFGAACIAYWPSLRRYALALTRDRDRAEDLVQDTFERALRKRALFRSGTDLCSWLIHMLHNILVSDVMALVVAYMQNVKVPLAQKAKAATKPA